MTIKFLFKPLEFDFEDDFLSCLAVNSVENEIIISSMHLCSCSKHFQQHRYGELIRRNSNQLYFHSVGCHPNDTLENQFENERPCKMQMK